MYQGALNGATLATKAMLVSVAIKGVTAKESEISCWLVSPAKRALKKIDIGPFLDGKSHIRPHTQNK